MNENIIEFEIDNTLPTLILSFSDKVNFYCKDCKINIDLEFYENNKIHEMICPNCRQVLIKFNKNYIEQLEQDKKFSKKQIEYFKYFMKNLKHYQENHLNKYVLITGSIGNHQDRLYNTYQEAYKYVLANKINHYIIQEITNYEDFGD